MTAPRPGSIAARYEELLSAVLDACQTAYADRLVALAIFGSVGRGTMRHDSDIDLLVVVDPLPDVPARRFNRSKPWFQLLFLRKRPKINQPHHRQYADGRNDQRQTCYDERNRNCSLRWSIDCFPFLRRRFALNRLLIGGCSGLILNRRVLDGFRALLDLFCLAFDCRRLNRPIGSRRRFVFMDHGFAFRRARRAFAR